MSDGINEAVKRATRRNQSRQWTDSHDTGARTILNHLNLSRFNLPNNFIERFPEYDFTFVTYSVGDVENYENLERHIEMGYEPVMSNDAPELTRRFSLGKNDDGYVKRAGQMLMRIKKEDKKKLLDAWKANNRRQHEFPEQALLPGQSVIFNERSNVNESELNRR